MAVAHFVREATLAVYAPEITPGRAVLLTSPIPERDWHPREMLFRVLLRTVLRALPPRTYLEVAFVGRESLLLKKLSGHLSDRNGFVSISIDAPWLGGGKGSFTRPFCGLGACSFTTGAARLSRLTQRPIVSCLCGLDDEGTVTLEWGDPITISPHEKGKEIAVTNELLDRDRKSDRRKADPIRSAHRRGPALEPFGKAVANITA